jgi:hypothetical protein
LAAAFPRQTQCVGNTEAVAMNYVGSPAGARIVGWGWAAGERTSPPRVVLVDRSSKIVGGGESGLERLDVPDALPTVTSNRTGWWAVTTRVHGRVEAFGVFPDERAACHLGHLDF